MTEVLFADRLRAVIGDESPTPWATARGISGATMHEWLTKGTTPYPKTMAKLVAGTGIEESWWLHGDLPPPEQIKGKAPEPKQREPQPIAGYVAIPLYNGVRAAAGGGAIVEHETPDDALVFKEEWVRIELGARPQDLYLIRVAGDSMEPTLRSGDVILVDRRATRPDREGVYILRMNEMLLVKRLQALPGGVVRVISDNVAFAPFEVKAADVGGFELAIVGRVVWTGRRM